MAQVQLFYSLTVTSIFKIKFLEFFLFWEYLANGESEREGERERERAIIAIAIRYEVMHLQSNGTTATVHYGIN